MGWKSRFLDGENSNIRVYTFKNGDYLFLQPIYYEDGNCTVYLLRYSNSDTTHTLAVLAVDQDGIYWCNRCIPTDEDGEGTSPKHVTKVELSNRKIIIKFSVGARSSWNSELIEFKCVRINLDELKYQIQAIISELKNINKDTYEETELERILKVIKQICSNVLGESLNFDGTEDFFTFYPFFEIYNRKSYIRSGTCNGFVFYSDIFYVDKMDNYELYDGKKRYYDWEDIDFAVEINYIEKEGRYILHSIIVYHPIVDLIMAVKQLYNKKVNLSIIEDIVKNILTSPSNKINKLAIEVLKQM